ncbi:MAG: hypothetical protein BHW25_06745 [Faecalibacterium sp. CAG:82-related_59_9]|nr:MAG: hypothetical protein BHW25_06745 [Faecalibacterium sp. CAG:82-related_59_9]
MAEQADSTRYDPVRLTEIEARLGEISALKRKYGASVEEVLAYLEDCRTQAEDSRDFGPVQCSAVKAKVITLIRRRGL